MRRAIGVPSKPARSGRVAPRVGVLLVLASTTAAAQLYEAPLPEDWCFDLPRAGRTDNIVARFSCGKCEGVIPEVTCSDSGDCPGGEACIDRMDQIVWYDARFDAAFNDVRTVATTQDELGLYVYVDFWNQPDPVLLSLVQLALDVGPGGSNELLDPREAVVAPGFCSGSPERACTVDEDCHFCGASYDLPCCDLGNCPPATECRLRPCGSGCRYDYDDVCDTSQTCVDVGVSPVGSFGADSAPAVQPDYVVVTDLGRWLIGAAESVQLNRWDAGWQPIGTVDIVPEPCCITGPPAHLRLAIPWDLFGCTEYDVGAGCGVGATAESCGCGDFGPGVEFGFSLALMRDVLNLDYRPDGAIEDVASEARAGATTSTEDSCPGRGTDALHCEIADGSLDAFVPARVSEPGGAVARLHATLEGSVAEPALSLGWDLSCSRADTDYAVYSGSLDGLPAYDHASVLCTTQGETRATFSPQAGNRYYLVVPSDGDVEGSYGSGWPTAPRPAASTPCWAPATPPACG